jgi:hypothetical protein
VVPNGRIVAVIALAASGALIAGCGGTGLLRSRSTATVAPLSNAAYVTRLGEAQARLARAEGSLPRRARTPAALSRAILQLSGAVRRLGRDLAAIRAPRAVASPHARLVSIVRTYAGRLQGASRRALRPGGELPAARALLESTRLVSRVFSATVSEIDRRLGQ